MSPKKFETNAI